RLAAYPARLEHLLVRQASLRGFPPAGWSSLPDLRRRRAPQLPVFRCHRLGPPGSRAAATHRESAPGSHLPALTRAAPTLPRSMEQRLPERATGLLSLSWVPAPSSLPAAKPTRKRGRPLRLWKRAARQPLPAPVRLSQFPVLLPALQQRHLVRPGLLARAGQPLPRPPLRRVRSLRVAAWLLPRRRQFRHPSNRPRAGTCVVARQSVRCCARRRARHESVRVA